MIPKVFFLTMFEFQNGCERTGENDFTRIRDSCYGLTTMRNVVEKRPHKNVLNVRTFVVFVTIF